MSKLGTPGLTNTDFEALVKCGAQAVPALSQALKSDRAEVRASAAYALGQIDQEAYAAVPNLVMMLRDDSSNDVRAIAAYTRAISFCQTMGEQRMGTDEADTFFTSC